MIDNSQVQRIKVQLERLRATTAFSGNSNSNNNSNSSIQYDYKLAVKNRVKTNIGQIISTSTDTGINTIVRFPEEHLQSILVLRPPAKLKKYEKKLNLREGVKAKATRPRMKKGTGSAKRSIKLAKVDIETNEDDDDINHGDISEEDDNMEESNAPLFPINFYPVANSFFDKFWNVNLTDTSVKSAFRAMIHAENCHEYGLDGFAGSPSSLTVIREKLRAERYVSIADFEYDFEVFFNNIEKFYDNRKFPAVLQQTRQLKAMFEVEWPKLLESFKY